MVGSAIVRQLNQLSYATIILRTREELDLTNQSQVNQFFREVKPDYVYLAAAKVGGIYANNTYPADFIYQNLMIEANIIHAAFLNKVKRLLFLGSSCIYPKFAKQPIEESELLTGPLEPTNEAYAIAKIAGIKLCESYNKQYGTDFRSAMPTNLYGPGDNYHPENSHVIPALIRRIHEAKINKEKEVIIWGTGKPKREFLYVEDMANACIFLMNSNKEFTNHMNIGYGDDITILDLANLIKKIIKFNGEIRLDHTKPDGAPQKLLNIEKIKSMGWQPSTSLENGLIKTYEYFLKTIK